MSSLGQLNISLTLESAKFQSALSKSDYEAQKFARNFVLNMDQATAKAKQFAQRTTDYLSNIEQAAKNINTATKWEFRFNNFDRVKNIASTYSKIADSYTELGSKLRLVTENETQHARAMVAVYDISLKTAQSTEATSSVYQTFAQNAKQLGISQNDVAKLTETVAKSVAVSGASSATASNALVQFSQSLLMGKLKAQEFNSLMTQTPSVIQAIAKGLIGSNIIEVAKLNVKISERREQLSGETERYTVYSWKINIAAAPIERFFCVMNSDVARIIPANQSVSIDFYHELVSYASGLKNTNGVIHTGSGAWISCLLIATTSTKTIS